MTATVEALRYAVRIVNNTPRVLRGALPGNGSSAALDVPPRSTVEQAGISADAAAHLISKGATASRRGGELVFEFVIDVTP